MSDSKIFLGLLLVVVSRQPGKWLGNVRKLRL